MSLADLIRKRESGRPANAHPANAANNDGQGGEPLAGLAAFALEVSGSAQADPDPAGASDPVDDPLMRTCRQCANLTPGGRCLAAWRGESFGDGIAVRLDFAPLDPHRRQRCLPYCPRPNDPDRRTGAERWPWLIAPGATSQ